MSNFSERLKELMFEREITSKQLGEKVGIDRSMIDTYLRGEMMPVFNNLINIADYFNCSTDFLLGLENNTYTEIFKKCPPFGERIKVVLKECDKTQYRVEQDCNISHSVFYYWKCGKTTPSSESLIKLAKYLGKTVDYIIGRSN